MGPRLSSHTRTRSSLRTIVDSLGVGSQHEQIELAVLQALEGGLTTPRRLQTKTTELHAVPPRSGVAGMAAEGQKRRAQRAT